MTCPICWSWGSGSVVAQVRTQKMDSWGYPEGSWRGDVYYPRSVKTQSISCWNCGTFWYEAHVFDPSRWVLWP